MKFESPITRKEPIVEKEKLQDAAHLNTIFNHIKPGEEENNLRLESFDKLSPNLKEALFHIGKTFNDADYPWAIHGSTALVLEGETSKKPVDIDLAFGKPDFEKVMTKFKNLESKGLVRKLESKEMRNFENKENGCIAITAEIKTGSIPNEEWIEVEAFAQNMDPDHPKNGITNIGLDKTGVNVYKEDHTEINFADREENFKFYLQVAFIELQKYKMDNAFLYKIKNKFPQRLNNIISIVKREEREKYEKEIKANPNSKIREPNIENITDENINKLIEEFVMHNSGRDIIKLADFAHSDIDPIEILKQRFKEFKIQKDVESNKERKGFVHQKIEQKNPTQGYTRENAIDELTVEGLEDMEEIATIHRRLLKLRETFNIVKEFCDGLKECEEDKLSKIIEVADDVAEESKNVFSLIKNVCDKYEKYLSNINYNDNRDFIPYVAIKQTMDEYILPSLELAIVSQNEIEEKQKELKGINSITTI